jgi:ABC-type glycerol-3-phosphate transport system permease component
VARGFVIGGGLNLVVFGIALGIGFADFESDVVHVVQVLFNWVAIGIWVAQLAYMVPLYLHFRKIGATETAKGLAIVAAITALLNGGCWVVVMANFNKL